MDRPDANTTNTAQLLPDGIIFVEYRGPQNYQTVMGTSQQTEQMVRELRQAGRPVKLLTDVSRVTSQTLGARQAGIEIVRRVRFDAFCVCGGSKFIKYLAIFFLRATGQPQGKYFDTVEEGLAWLRRV